MQSEADPPLVINVPIGKGWRRSKVGYINGHGVQVIPPRFDDGLKFSDGLAAAKLGKKWGFIDRSGEFAIPPAFPHFHVFTRVSPE
jgi:WG containing repeat